MVGTGNRSLPTDSRHSSLTSKHHSSPINSHSNHNSNMAGNNSLPMETAKMNGNKRTYHKKPSDLSIKRLFKMVSR